MSDETGVIGPTLDEMLENVNKQEPVLRRRISKDVRESAISDVASGAPIEEVARASDVRVDQQGLIKTWKRGKAEEYEKEAQEAREALVEERQRISLLEKQLAEAKSMLAKPSANPDAEETIRALQEQNNEFKLERKVLLSQFSVYHAQLKEAQRASDEHRYSMRFITQVLLDAFLSLPNDKQDTILSSNRRQGNAKYE